MTEPDLLIRDGFLLSASSELIELLLSRLALSLEVKDSGLKDEKFLNCFTF